MNEQLTGSNKYNTVSLNDKRALEPLRYWKEREKTKVRLPSLNVFQFLDKVTMTNIFVNVSEMSFQGDIPGILSKP